MQCYAKYFCRHLLLPIFIIASVLTGLIWITQLLRFTDLMIHRGLSVQHFFSFAILLVPSFLNLVIPIAGFVGTIYVYHKLSVDCEIIILKQAGTSRFSLLKPAIWVGILLIIIGYSLTLYISPLTYHQFKNKQLLFRENNGSFMLEEGVFNNPMPGFMFYIDDRDEHGLMKGVLVEDSRNPEKRITLIAQNGRIIKKDGKTYINLIHGSRQEWNEEKSSMQILHFEHYPLDITAYSPDISSRWKEADERFLHELFSPGTDDIQYKFLLEAHQRLIWPWYSLIAVLLAALGMSSDSPSYRHRRKKTVIVLSTTMFLLLVIALMLPSLSAYYRMAVTLMYALVVISMLLLVMIVFSSRKLLRHLDI